MNYAKISTLEQFDSEIRPALDDRKKLVARYYKRADNYWDLKSYLERQSKECNHIPIFPWFQELHESAWFEKESGYKDRAILQRNSRSMDFGRP